MSTPRDQPGSEAEGLHSGRTSVVLVEPHGILRQFLRGFVRQIESVDVVGEAGTHAAAVDVCVRTKPAVVIVAWSVSDPTRTNLVMELRHQLPMLRALVLSTVTKEVLRDALAAGIRGFIDSNETLPVLDRGIRAVASGRQFFCTASARIMREFMATHGSPDGASQLGDREILVLRQIARGKASKEIAHDLGASVFTVENIRRRIMKKTGLHSIAELTLHAVKLRLVPAPQLRADPANGSTAQP